MSKSPGRCIFCGSGRLTKEHILPRWLQGVLPKKFAGLSHSVTRLPYPDGSVLPLHSSYRPTRQGDPLVRTLRVVCRTCNNGWMSKLQNIAKPSLLPLILNADWSGLTIGDLKSIASWVAMTCAVNEYADPPTVSIPQEDRTYLMARLEPPSERWTIWMGRFEGAADRDFWHSGLCYWPLDDTHPGVHDDFSAKTFIYTECLRPISSEFMWRPIETSIASVFNS